MALPKDHPHWKRMRFKRNKVWMAVDAEQQPLLENSKVLIKFQLDQPHEYWVHPASVAPLASTDSPPPPAPFSPAKSAKSALTKIEKVQDDQCLQSICIYTDGACSGNPGPAGLGVVMRYKDERKEISRYIGQATNNIAELEAIKAGLMAVKGRNLPVILFSDSTYALGVLTLGWKAKQNIELIEEIKQLISTYTQLRFVKVKGHAGHPDNERADRLAVQSIESGG